MYFISIESFLLLHNIERQMGSGGMRALLASTLVFVIKGCEIVNEQFRNTLGMELTGVIYLCTTTLSLKRCAPVKSDFHVKPCLLIDLHCGYWDEPNACGLEVFI